MLLLDQIHKSYVFPRRVRTLANHLAGMIPTGSRVLDVGCGSGQLAQLLLRQRPDLELAGIDVLVRPHTFVPVTAFDGRTIPHESHSFDVVLFVDVLHHTEDPMVLLREAARVASRAVVIKDHTADGLLASPTLRFLDQVGNARYGVALPNNYWPERQWAAAFAELGLNIAAWESDLQLYPWPATWLFDRSLHFVARLEPAEALQTVHP